jgi:hypothetical protein
MWRDAKFTRLSPLRPSAQALWLYLLTGPHTTVLPGVFVAGRAAMAEALGWAQRDFDAASAEIQDTGMAVYDLKTHLWFLPKAIAHNPPANPNVVRSWRTPLAVLPECQLRERIVRELRAELSRESGAWVEAFDEAIGLAPRMRSPNPSGKPSPKALVEGSPKALVEPLPNQEQEQEQQPESIPPSLRSGGTVCENDSQLEPALPGRAPAHGGASSASPSAGVHPTPGPGAVSHEAKARATGVTPCPYEAIVALYHEVLPELPGVRLIDDKRQKAMRRVWAWCFTSTLETGQYRATNAQEALAWFRLFFDRVRTSDWLMGRTRRTAGHEGWECSLDYLMSPAGHKHVIERL